MVSFTKMPELNMSSPGVHNCALLSRNHKKYKPTGGNNAAYGRYASKAGNEILPYDLITDKMFPLGCLPVSTTAFPQLEWDGSRIDRRFHSGRTDYGYGHNDYRRVSGLEQYHYHHTLGPHIPCAHFQPQGESLIDLFEEYGGSVWTSTHVLDGRKTYSFHASIEVEPDVKYFTLDITGRTETSEFCIGANAARTRVELFFGTSLRPIYVKREKSLWKGEYSGFDYLVDAEYFHALANKHTGLPNPVSQHVTAKMLRNFGWKDSLLTADYVDKLNNTLELYGIIDPKSIKLFLATCGHESGKGRDVLERLNSDGTTNGDYKPYERGAGYLQITKRVENHLPFLATVNDSYTELNTAEYIAENYPWEASGWYWAEQPSNLKSVLISSDTPTLNDFIIKHGDSLSMYLLVQYAVNGWSGAPTNEVAERIMNGAQWRVEDNRLIVDGESDTFLLPNGWADREKNYYDAVNVFK